MLVAGVDLGSATGKAVILKDGDIIASQMDLHWVQVEDEFGVSKALQWKKQKSFVFPITMLSKRIGWDTPINVLAIYDKVVVDVAIFKEMGKLDGMNPRPGN